jgi:hypothetical protein
MDRVGVFLLAFTELAKAFFGGIPALLRCWFRFFQLIETSTVA